MKKLNLALILGALLSSSAFAYDQQDCADYVKEMNYPASYCLLTTEESPELETWLEQLRNVTGPIRSMEKALLEDAGCDSENSCGLSAITLENRIVLEQGNDSMGGGSRVRYFISLSQGKLDSVIYTVDVTQDFDMRSETSIRKVGKIQKFED